MDNQEQVVEKKEKKKSDIKKEIFQWVQAMIVSVLVVGFLFAFVGRPSPVDGSSMSPTFENKDLVISTPIYGELERGDVVALKRQKNTSLIKRVIAVEGDVVNIDYANSKVYVNDELLDEPYIAEPITRDLGQEFPMKVPEGCVFVMGDNRNHSDDSRNPKIGSIDERNIFGKVVLRIYPFDRMEIIK